jgi:hypothetical protein
MLIHNAILNPKLFARILSLYPRNFSTSQSLPIPPNIAVLQGPADWAEARKWVEQFKTESIPKSLVELSFARSSGPGGQVSLRLDV